MAAGAGQDLAIRRSFGDHRARIETEGGIQRWRGLALAAGIVQTLILTIGRPGLLWGGLSVLALSWLAAVWVLRHEPTPTDLRRLAVFGMAADIVVAALVLASSTSDPADPVQLATLFLAVEGAVRWGRTGGIVLGVVGGALTAAWTVAVHAEQHLPLPLGFVTFRMLVVLIIGALLGVTVSAVRRQRRLAETVCNASRDLIATFDLKGTILTVNPACEATLGYRAEELVGKDRADLVAPEHRPAGAPDLALLRTVGPRLVELPFVHREGHLVWLELDLQPDWEEGLVYAIGRDVTSRRRAEHDLRHRADHDSLTGAANRSRLVARLDRVLGREQAVALLFVDLDGFKGVNDSHGHGAGDRVLVGVVDRLRTVVDHDDLVVRLAGDEFCVLIDDPDGADATAARVVAALAEPFALDEDVVALTASVGLAASRPDDTPADLLERADQAMYQQKRATRRRRAVRADDPMATI